MRTSIQACGAATTTCGAAETQRSEQLEALIGVGDLFAHEVLAGDAEMCAARGELRHDLRGRQIGDLDPGQPGERAAVVARPASLLKLEPCSGEKRGGALLQPPLGRDGENERRVPRLRPAKPSARSPVRQPVDVIAAPTAGMSSLAPRRRASPS